MLRLYIFLVAFSLLIAKVCSQESCDSPLWQEQLASVSSGPQVAVDSNHLAFAEAYLACSGDTRTIVSGSSYDPVKPNTASNSSVSHLSRLKLSINTERSQAVWGYAKAIWNLSQTDREILERRVVLLAAGSSLFSNTISIFRWTRNNSSTFIKSIEHKVQPVRDSASWIVKHMRQFFLLIIGTVLSGFSFDFANTYQDNSNTRTLQPLSEHRDNQHVPVDRVGESENPIDGHNKHLYVTNKTDVREPDVKDDSVKNQQQTTDGKDAKESSPTQQRNELPCISGTKFHVDAAKSACDKPPKSSPNFAPFADLAEFANSTSDTCSEDHRTRNLKIIPPLPLIDDEAQDVIDANYSCPESASRVSLTEDTSTTNQDFTPAFFSPTTPTSSEQGFIVNSASRKRSIKAKTNSDHTKSVVKGQTDNTEGFSAFEFLLNTSNPDVNQRTDANQSPSQSSSEAIRSSQLQQQPRRNSKGSSLRVTKHKILGHSIVVPQHLGFDTRVGYTGEPSPISETTSLCAKGWIESGKSD